MALYQPLDLESIFVVDVAGTPEIFSFLAILLFSLIFSKFNLSGKIVLPLFVLFGVIMSAYLGGLYVLALILVGLSTFYALSKAWR